MRDLRSRKGNFFRNDDDNSGLDSCMAFAWKPLSRAQRLAITGMRGQHLQTSKVRCALSEFTCVLRVQTINACHIDLWSCNTGALGIRCSTRCT